MGTAILRYIEHGEALGVPDRFNCKDAQAWYGVEPVPARGLLRHLHVPRSAPVSSRNELGARCLSSLLNLWSKDGIEPERLRPILEDEANAQLLREFGRTYGGGLGKIEPGDLLAPTRPSRIQIPKAARGGVGHYRGVGSLRT